jgi:uridine kinase
MSKLILGIAGGTGSGKSTIAQKVASALPEGSVTKLEYDAYYRHRPDLSAEEKQHLNYDHPDALETELLVEHVKQLRAGEAVETPLYDFKTHARMKETKRLEPTPVIIVEGILTFVSPELRDVLDIKIFVDTDADIRAFRRIRRDIEQRGRTFQSVREQYYSTVRPMHLEFVEPSKRWADIIIPEGGDNNVAIDMVIVKLGHVVANPPS